MEISSNRRTADRGPGTRPTVSILTPAYNEQEYIADCMASVQAQTLSDFEQIIVDDQSTDDTFAVAQQKTDCRTHVLANPSKGKLAAFKHAYAHSTGRFVVLLAADDTLPIDSLEKRVRCLQGVDPLQEMALVRGHHKAFSDDPKFDDLVIPKHARGHFSGGTIIMTRKFADLAFDMPDDLPNEDSWIRLCAEHLDCRIVESPGVTLNYRIHSGNSSSSRGSFVAAKEGYSKREKVAEAFLNRFESNLSEASRNRLRARLNLEEARSQRAVIKLLTIRGVSIAEKFRALVFCYEFAYEIRQRFWRQLVGLRD